MKTVAFDLETIANPAMIDHLPPIEPNPRLKDPQKIKDDIAEKKFKQLESMALDKLTNLICCASFRDFETGETTSFWLDDAMDEKKLLEDVWRFLWPYKRFVSFNGRAFDIPNLLAHSCKHRVSPSVNISTRRYTSENHYDLRMILSDWDTHARGNFDFYCKYFLGEGKPEKIDGSMVQHYWDCGLIQDIVKYCEDDVEKLHRLYEWMKGYYL